ncbi:MAG: radical SAM protein [Desulfobacteraceae bacterium]
MIPSHTGNLAINVEKQGPSKIQKQTFPLRHGKYSEIRTSEFEFVFNLNGEIKYIRGLGPSWPHPAEQLKRTDGNDWVFYSVGDDSTENGLVSWMGEYYLPCLPYPSNPIWEINYFSNPAVMNAFGAWPQLYADLYMAPKERFNSKARKLIGRILENSDQVLHERAGKLHSITGGRVSVLPPDTRHVDYEVIPLFIADGCFYNCRFCCVKSDQPFQSRSRADIMEQIDRLREFYGRDLENCNALFLGNHDALGADTDIITPAAAEAYKAFGFESNFETPMLFLFASVKSLLQSTPRFFDTLKSLPFYIYINVGLESADQPTLQSLGKPLTGSGVREAFQKMADINRSFGNIEVTANFVIGQGLPETHYESVKELLQDAPDIPGRKGGVYLSPLKDSPKKRELLPLIREIKDSSKLPVYVYLIQRL